MRIRVMHFGACTMAVGVGAIVFLADLLIGQATRASPVPAWSRQCTVEPVPPGSAKATCGDYTTQFETDPIAVAALTKRTLTCAAYRTRTVSTLKLECKP